MSSMDLSMCVSCERIFACKHPERGVVCLKVMCRAPVCVHVCIKCSICVWLCFCYVAVVVVMVYNRNN